MVFTFHEHTIKPRDIKELYELDSSYAPLVDFVRSWLADEQTFQFKTSGSTGKPGVVEVSRNQIEASVKATAAHLGLQKGEHILLALAPTYIASTMMVARGLMLDMDVHIVKPSANPFEDIPGYHLDFASFVPYQIYHIIEAGKLDMLAKIRNVLVGGAPLNDDAFEQLAALPNQCYMTYGLTETVSHIALMPVKDNPDDAAFHLLPNLSIGVNENNCLWVEGTVTNQDRIQTMDVVEMTSDTSFKWMGRNDFIINSGGIKIFSEKVEKLIAVMFRALGLKNEFYLIGEQDDQLGQKVVLVVESNEPIEGLLDKIKPAIVSQFSKYHAPRDVRFVSNFERTSSGKVRRV